MNRPIIVGVSSLLLGLASGSILADAHCDACPSSGEIFCEDVPSGGDYWHWSWTTGVAVYQASPNGLYIMTWGCIASGATGGLVEKSLEEETVTIQGWGETCST